ncbi:hypothetical protein [Streptomyces sp. NPDC053560]|uniref:hypothetical protein n=1 Tax=Streptomyces sp. NPDC053560 TaxID=3365711 RepID=UPI0037D07C4B
MPPLARSLRTLGDFAARHEVNDATLAEIAEELDRARVLVASARGARRANACTRHPGGPVDPTAENGCLLCGTTARRPARPIPEDFVPGEVLRFLTAHGHEAAADQFGARAVARALATGGRHPSQGRPTAAEPPESEGEPAQ